MHPTTKHWRRAAVAAGAFCAAITVVAAQAWVPGEKSGIFDVTFARATATRHLFSEPVFVAETGVTGKSVYYGYEYSNIGAASFDYGVTKRLAVRGDLSFVESKYNGLPAWQESSDDDGQYHGTMTDFRFEARYLAFQKGGFVLTPFAGFVFPTHQYNDEGHAAPGRGLTQYPLGVGAGYTWTRPIHTTWLQGRYSYAFLLTEGFTFARSNAFVEAGTYLARWCTIRGLLGGEQSHGGIDWATDIDTQGEFDVHDARTDSRYWSAGVGVAFIVTPAISLSASYSEILGGANVVNTHTLWVSTTWYFGGPGSKIIGKSK